MVSTWWLTAGNLMSGIYLIASLKICNFPEKSCNRGYKREQHINYVNSNKHKNTENKLKTSKM